MLQSPFVAPVVNECTTVTVIVKRNIGVGTSMCVEPSALRGIWKNGVVIRMVMMVSRPEKGDDDDSFVSLLSSWGIAS